MTKGLHHHAYVVEGPKEKSLKHAKVLVERELGLETNGNPDVWIQEFDSLGIDDTRVLKSFHMDKPIRGQNKAIIISFNNVSVEAQNALLKVLEEPLGKSHFFLIVPDKDMFLPTILSRVEVIKSGDWEITVDGVDARKFLNYSREERLKEVEPIVKNKDKEAAAKLLNNLESVLDEEVELDEFSHKMRVVLNARRNLATRSSSIKMILEDLSLRL